MTGNATELSACAAGPARQRRGQREGLLLLFGKPLALGIPRQFATTFTLAEDRHDLLETCAAAGDLTHQTEQIFTRAIARSQIHQHHRDECHMKIQLHTLSVVTDQVVEIPVTLQPAKKTCQR